MGLLDDEDNFEDYSLTNVTVSEIAWQHCVFSSENFIFFSIVQSRIEHLHESLIARDMEVWLCKWRKQEVAVRLHLYQQTIYQFGC